MEQEILHIPFNKLVRSPNNVRTVSPSKTADKLLIAAIKSQGLLQNLVVKPAAEGKRYEVTAGGRRLGAVAHLVASGDLPDDVPLPCQIRDDAASSEVSLMENIARESMHPADEFEAFQAMVKEGLSEQEIAAHFGIAKKHVQKRLKLAAVAPSLIKQYRSNKLTLEELMAFTLADDQDRQLACWNDIHRGHFSPHQIRRWLTQSAEKSSSALARFVGLPAYKKAGGTVTTDLFGDEGYLDDRGLLVELAEKKLEAEQGKIAKEGWKWVDVAHDGDTEVFNFMRLEPSAVDVPAKLEKKIATLKADLEQLDELDDWTDAQSDQQETTEAALEAAEQEREQYFQYLDEDKARGGCVVSYNYEGKLTVYRGLLRREDARSSGKKQSAKDAADTEQTASISAALRADLTLYRQQIVKAALANNANVANDVLLYTLYTQVLDEPGWRPDRLMDARFDVVNANTSLDDLDSTPAGQTLNKIRARLNTSWLAEEDSAARFTALRALPAKDKKALTAFAVAQVLTVSLADGDPDGGAGEQMIADLDINFAAQWRPSAENFFKRIKTGDLLNLGADCFGVKWLDEHAKAKKGDLAAHLHALFNVDNAELDETAKTVTQTWLPEGFINNEKQEAN